MTGASAGQLVLDLPPRNGDLKLLLGRVRAVLVKHRGASPVFFRLHDSGRPPVVHRSGEEHFVQISDDLVEELEQELGPGAVSLR
jgi:hypothetical protein